MALLDDGRDVLMGDLAEAVVAVPRLGLTDAVGITGFGEPAAVVVIKGVMVEVGRPQAD